MVGPRVTFTPLTNAVLHQPTADDFRYECPTGDQDAEYKEVKASDPSEVGLSCLYSAYKVLTFAPDQFGRADAAEISARDGFLDSGGSRYARIVSDRLDGALKLTPAATDTPNTIHPWITYVFRRFYLD